MTDFWTEVGPALLPAFWVTIKLTFFSAIGALILGTILTAMRVSPVAILRSLATGYIEVLRNTPLTLIVLYQNLGLALAPENDEFIVNNNFWLAVLGFTLYTAAFVAESLRSGINTVPFGQAEAARSLGLPFSQVFSKIIFPQAFRAAIIPLGNTTIALTKNTTIASMIGVAEASLLMKETLENNADLLFPTFGLFALGFVILTLPMGLIFGRVGRKMAVKH